MLYPEDNEELKNILAYKYSNSEFTAVLNFN
jgi:hypothetical protein